jgi:hypothetical protein
MDFAIVGNAKVNVKGRVNLGFGWIEKKDLQSNKLTRIEYSQPKSTLSVLGA